MSEKHLSSSFEADLNLLSSRLLEMGGLVESQTALALAVLNEFDGALVATVLEGEHQLNAMEIAIDEEVSHIIARRQPAARDLRFLLATSKCITNLERAGDEARKLVKRMRRIHRHGAPRAFNIAEIKISGEMALKILHKALDAFARMDAVGAAQIVREDEAVDKEFRAFVRNLVTYMMEDPRTISTGLEYLFIAKAIERIGDHATNIAESVVYVVRGTDIRHEHRKQREHEALHG
ncbi:phosphate signaling complex protein PhoU [Paraburkholderia sp. BL6669N2]|uniref:phosphate signaling complex protein PhoU n=1 Tax=Paraburkholderia sp. BL6669N2 TaxID=1938807 RepID=UPI000E23A925|nr:phosphate signaling complex protein PhoU [Paraburkholderia sp. BL6669N2]